MKPRRPARKRKLPAFVRKALEPYVEEAGALGSEFLEQAAERFGSEPFECSVDSVRVLDHICRFNRAGFDDGLVLRAGLFFGEMLRRAYGGRYQWDPRMNALSLELEGLTVYPIEKVRRIVAEKDAGTLEEYLMVLAKKIADQRGYGKSGDRPPPPRRR